MAQQPPFRDYLYVSARKVERLAAALPGKKGRRLREINVNAGPVGAGFALSDAPARTAIGAISDIEAALYDERRVHWVDDSRLASGDWFTVKAMDMAYGAQPVPDPAGEGTSLAALFVGKVGAINVVLSGSAEHMLDRRLEKVDIGASMSDPQAIDRLLRGLADDEPKLMDGRQDADGHDYAIANALGTLGRYGLHPLTFLARAIGVTPADEGWDGQTTRNVIGTPLWVASASSH